MFIKNKTQLFAAVLGVSFIAIIFSGMAKASEASILYDNGGNAVVAYLTCENKSTPTVLFTQDKKPVAAYIQCAEPAASTKDEAVTAKEGPIAAMVSSTRSTARRTARRVSNRNND
ncbi:MAG: hypothetical protein COB59_01650 [Rhodospirillaceae bacterium]|nr:MAG: hypothetical protein COB59_01650 [Rhodospirillaceae bacterium]